MTLMTMFEIHLVVYFLFRATEGLMIDLSHFVKSILIFAGTPVWWLAGAGNSDSDGMLQQIFSLSLEPGQISQSTFNQDKMFPLLGDL